jgi:hypothetical protein
MKKVRAEKISAPNNFVILFLAFGKILDFYQKLYSFKFYPTTD